MFKKEVNGHGRHSSSETNWFKILFFIIFVEQGEKYSISILLMSSHVAYAFNAFPLPCSSHICFFPLTLRNRGIEISLYQVSDILEIHPH
jgi:hypothetical protein